MKIDQSVVATNACHNFSSECEFRIKTETSFRTVFDGVAQAESTSISDAEDRSARLLVMLEELIARMLELMSGKQESQITDIHEVLQTEERSWPEGNKSRGALRMVVTEWKNELTETIREHESTDFSSTGKIRTADGRNLEFTLDLAMCRDYACERKVTTSHTVRLRDPLVINFGGNAVELSGKRFAFDLDADGETESIFGLGSGSGYLAIDRNVDGRVNDGSELFGTRSGNGFFDLTKLDDDGNHWLDESDAAFGALRIWQRDDAGNDTLSTLRDTGVGALYLESTETPFSLTDSENRLLAQIRASGVYLREDGGAGTLQQVDLAV